MTTRVTPWQDGVEPTPPEDLLTAMRDRRPNGELIGIDRVLLRSTPLATGWNQLLGKVRREFSLRLEYRELIMLRVAVLNGADFEWGVHHPAHLQAGGTEEKAAALTTPQIDPLFDQREQALITLADQSTRNVEVDADLIAQLQDFFGETETVEAVATVAAYNMVSRFLVALAI